MNDTVAEVRKEIGQIKITENVLQTPATAASQDGLAEYNTFSELQVEQPAKIRSKLRTFAVLLALYVS